MNTVTLANKTSLYIDDNGRIVCPDHGGTYLKSAYAVSPEQATYYTPLGTWEKAFTDFIVMWVDETGSAPKCGQCNA